MHSFFSHSRSAPGLTISALCSQRSFRITAVAFTLFCYKGLCTLLDRQLHKGRGLALSDFWWTPLPATPELALHAQARSQSSVNTVSRHGSAALGALSSSPPSTLSTDPRTTFPSGHGNRASRDGERDGSQMSCSNGGANGRVVCLPGQRQPALHILPGRSSAFPKPGPSLSS